MEYPTNNIFISPQWNQRTAELQLQSPKFTIQRLYGLKLALLRSGILADFEEWPREFERGNVDADWIAYRKLLADQKPTAKKKVPFYQRPYVTPYTNSPYLDLTQPLHSKKSAISHIYRTERKLTREIAAPTLREFRNPEERAQWFHWYVEFQSAKNRISGEQKEMLRKWTQEGPLPQWMKLTGLMAGDVPLVMGLFYKWDGVFYYFSSTMTSDPAFNKYGPGKIFVEKLVQRAIAEGATTFDFLQGDHDYKEHWNPKPRALYQCIYPVSVKGYIALTLFRLKQWINNKNSPRTFPNDVPWMASTESGAS